jgi:ABC-type multidrug transport system ATPase subunit
VRSTRLEARFREFVPECVDERVRPIGHGAPQAMAVGSAEEVLCFAVAFARLCVRTLGLVSPNGLQCAAITRSIMARTGWQPEWIDQLLLLALLPEFRGSVSPAELWVFGCRFGDEAASALQAEEDELDLRGFANGYSPNESLLLLDTLFSVAGVTGEIGVRDVRRLEIAGQELGVDSVLVTALLKKHDHRHASGDIRFSLSGNRISIGRAPGCEAILPDPQVAPRHAELVRVGDGWRVVDQESGRPTVLNGAAVASAPMREGDQLRIGPYVLHLADDQLVAFGERRFSALSVRRLSRKIGDITLIDDVSFTVFSGEVIAVVGPSGCGKTTLLNAINGVAPADSGTVLFEGTDFHRQLKVDRSLVGVVPQDDLVNAELTVEESLFYSGRLRYEPDVTDKEVRAQVDRVLAELELDHIRHARIGNELRRGISGGQRKRVNLGQELMTRTTRVLFLDEPTSGLDPRASQDIVRRVRQLADRGQIVFLVTHDLTPEIISQVDHMLVLATGGRLAFFGPPREASEWFGVSTPDAVFARFADRTSEDWGAAYRAGPVARKYVATREHVLGFEGIATSPSAEERTYRRSLWGQFRALSSRYLRVKLRDKTGMMVLGAQPPLLALVMWIVFPKPTTSLMFMLALSCLWFGMSSTVRELIVDRVIWRRERRVGIGVLPYLGSKVMIMGLLVAVQCIFFSAILFGSLSLGGYGFHLPSLMGVCLLTGWVGMALGLLVSASWTSSEAAVGTLPLLLIPQITLSSIMVSVRSMGDLAEFLSWFMVQRYAFDAVIKCGDELAYFKYGSWQTQRVRGFLYELGLKFTADVDDVGLSLEALCGILCGFTGLFLVTTTIIVWARFRRG